MISNATNPLIESQKESLLSCAGSTSICEWLVCDLVVMYIQAVGDRALPLHTLQPHKLICRYMAPLTT